VRILFALIVACSTGLAIEFLQNIELPSAVVGGFFLIAWWASGSISSLKHA
jgi:hypothetical protein